MIEHHLDIPTADGAMNSVVVHPEEGGPLPVVLFYMDAPGGAGSGGDAAPHRVVPGCRARLRVPQRTGVYDRPAAERHWERLYSLFERSLRRPA